MNLDAAIDGFLSPIADKISSIIFYSVNIKGVEVQLLIALLMFSAVYFTYRLRFIGFWGFKHALRLIANKFVHKDLIKRQKKGEVSSFQALSATISSSAGIGNVAGSAAAVSIGGPGVIFWMIVAGLFSMALKFSEVLLGVKLRQVNPDGSTSGGPMYYISMGLKGPILSKIAPHLGKIYAFCCVLAVIGGWNLFQINAMTTQITEVTGGAESIFANNSWMIGLFVAIVTWITIIGGIKSIGSFTEKVTPAMCVFYLTSILIISLMNIQHIPHTIKIIITQAFQPQAVAGGVFGCMLWGFRRAMFANEAGLGTAPTAFAAVKTSKPVAQAFIAMLQPFVDTCIVGVATAFVIVVSGEYLNVHGIAGIELTSKAFASAFSFFPVLLTIMASFFVMGTMLCGSYYGLKNWQFLVGDSKLKTRSFQLLYCVCIVIGSAMNFKSIINLSDAVTLFMAVPNLFALFILSNVVVKEVKRYCKKYDVGLFSEVKDEPYDEATDVE
ncbi:alanine:cation symporter family protein [bacterium]|nr:alanine:cation symporter family protein [bacterium]